MFLNDGFGYLCYLKTSKMNLQTILDPIGKLTEDSFEFLLVPMSDLVNWGSILLGFIGLLVWLNLQAKYTARAKREGNII